MTIAAIGSLTQLDPRLNARPSQAFAPTYTPSPTFGLDNFSASRLAPLGPTLPAAAQPTLDQLEGPPTGGSLPTSMEPTLPMLLAGGASSVYLQSGSRGRDVQLVQRQLLTAGFNPGAVDGVMGPQTVQALRQFQASRGLTTDGVVGAQTCHMLGLDGYLGRDQAPTGYQPTGTPQRTQPRAHTNGAVQHRLLGSLYNRYKGVRHQCFRYAWTMATAAGGRGIENASVSHAGRNAPITSLNAMISNGQVRTGDVIYVNRRPGADPSSTNLAYGPHWFVYLGNGKFADQYGQRDANAMANFVPGRRIDAIYHPFAGEDRPQTMYA